MKFAHFTDLHLPIHSRPGFGALLNKRILGYQSWLRKRRKRHQRWTLDALIEDLRNQCCSAALISGDIVNIALPAEFDDAAAWLETAFKGLPTAMVPGNHDSYVALAWAQGMGKLERHMKGWRQLPAQGRSTAPSGPEDFPFIADLPGAQQICVIAANSAPPTAPGLASGALTPGQIERLATQLSAAQSAGLYTILMLHHPINEGVVSWRKGLDDAPALRRVIAEHGVDLVLHGHTHFPCLHDIATPNGPAPVFGGGSASHAGSHGRYRPARYAILDITQPQPGAWATHITVREIDMETRAVTTAETHHFTRSRPAQAA